MGIASDLRQSVLQAAMQGKLTTQKAEDGDARGLLREIRAEKEKLVKEKKGKKGKPLAPIRDEEIPFDIPENWVWIRLGNYTEIARGGSPRPINNYLTTGKDGINWIKIGDTDKNGKYISETAEKIIREGITKSRYVKKGSFLLSNSMSFGRPYILNIDGCIHDGWLVLSNYEKLLNCDYLYYVLSSPLSKRQFVHQADGAVVKNLNTVKVQKIVIPLPPLPEQQRIVARVEALMKEIEELEQTEKELEAIKAAFSADMKASLLQAAMQGKLTTQKAEDGDAKDLLLSIREEKEKLVKEKKGKKEKPLAPITDEEIPFDIPENWVWCRLNDITVKEIRRGKSPKYSDVQSNTLSFAQKCNTKYDGIQMSLAKYLDESTLKRYTEEDAIIDGDTIINSTGHGTLGRVGFFTDSNNPNHLTIYPDSHVTVVRPSRNCDSRFIHLYIKTQQSWFETKGEGSTNQTELKPAVIKSIVIPLPPLPEQQRIVEKLDQLLPLCDSLSEH